MPVSWRETWPQLPLSLQQSLLYTENLATCIQQSLAMGEGCTPAWETPQICLCLYRLWCCQVSCPHWGTKQKSPQKLSVLKHSQMRTTTKVETLLLKLGFNMHLGLSLDIKQLFHKYCLWWMQFLHYSPQTEHLLLFCFKRTLWQGH